MPIEVFFFRYIILLAKVIISPCEKAEDYLTWGRPSSKEKPAIYIDSKRQAVKSYFPVISYLHSLL